MEVNQITSILSKTSFNLWMEEGKVVFIHRPFLTTDTAVLGNNLMKEINERWDCQREIIPNDFCVILDKTSFSKAKLLGFYGKISKKSQ